jgi:hypothetical protein
MTHAIHAAITFTTAIAWLMLAVNGAAQAGAPGWVWLMYAIGGRVVLWAEDN